MQPHHFSSVCVDYFCWRAEFILSICTEDVIFFAISPWNTKPQNIIKANGKIHRRFGNFDELNVINLVSVSGHRIITIYLLIDS